MLPHRRDRSDTPRRPKLGRARPASDWFWRRDILLPLTPTTDAVLVSRDGYELLADPILNKGTAFDDDEREAFHLHGLLPPKVATLEEQVARRSRRFDELHDDLDRHMFLREMQDTNETLFYALLLQRIGDMLPIVYTPTVGSGCELFSQIFRKPRGLFLSPPLADRLDEILAHPRYDAIECIVVTDGERILGLGDQGAGGMGIPIGKLALYTACGGLHPSTTLPIMLDTGTDNQDRLDDPIYIGWRHHRIRGEEYDRFVERFVSAVAKRWPHVLLQWEDFAGTNAGPLLKRYRDRLCSFNDDIQGTAVVVVGTLLAAMHASGKRLADQTIAVLGAGSAGFGIAALLYAAMIEDGVDPADAQRRFFPIGLDGLITQDGPEATALTVPFLPSQSVVAGWRLEQANRIGLTDVVRNATPTILIGTCGQGSVFSETAIRAMADRVQRPIIFPLSNPTSRAEATPGDLLRWTDGRALIGTGSPFPPVLRDGRHLPIDQVNNVYVFPGIGLGTIVAKASRVTNGMLMAAARALALLSPTISDPAGTLLPPVTELRNVALHVAAAVARQAHREGVSPVAAADIEKLIRNKMWQPAYRPYRLAR